MGIRSFIRDRKPVNAFRGSENGNAGRESASSYVNRTSNDSTSDWSGSVWDEGGSWHPKKSGLLGNAED